MKDNNISEAIRYVGVDDKDLDLFESQYKVPNGVSYNSYVILDDKITVMDGVDDRGEDEWLANIEKLLEGKKPDYLVVLHFEPDHSGGIEKFLVKYPETTVVGNAKTFSVGSNFVELDKYPQHLVKEGDELCLGKHTLKFMMAPMVHWPEVMLAFEETEGVLFSADAFGKFGALEFEEDNWVDEARRYYINIVGKYGAPVQTVLKKAAALDIKKIAPLHGPVLSENLEKYIGLYDTWSSYKPEESGVLVAYASIHGNTELVAKYVAKKLEEKGEKVVLTDLTRQDKSQAVADAFRFDRMVLAASSYDGGVFIPMEDFLVDLSYKTYQNRKVALIENGSWGPTAGRKMKGHIEGFKNVEIIGDMVTIKSRAKDADYANVDALVEAVIAAKN